MPNSLLSAFDSNRILLASSVMIAVAWALKAPALTRALTRRNIRKPLSVAKRLQIAALLLLAPTVFILIMLGLPAKKKPIAKPKPTIVKITLLPEPAQQVKPPVPPPEAASKPKPLDAPKRPAKPQPIANKPAPKMQTRPAEVSDKKDTELARLLAEAQFQRFENFRPPVNTTVGGQAGESTAAQNQAQAKGIERASCVFCPELDYPTLARRRGWQGGVLLKFQLTPEGLAKNIAVVQGSGHGVLDEAAIANVRQSRFTSCEAGSIRVATKEFKFKLK